MPGGTGQEIYDFMAYFKASLWGGKIEFIDTAFRGLGSKFSSWMLISMVGMLVPLKGGKKMEKGSIFEPPRLGKDYKWYISGIYCQLGDYMPPIPPFRGTRNNH